MKTIFYPVLIFLILLTSSCENENFVINNELLGKWSYTEEVKPQGIIVYELVIYDDSFFSKVIYFGTYLGQNNQDLSSWHEISGHLEERQNTLNFRSENHIWWDSFYDNMTPVSEEINDSLFDDCTYQITSNSLELTYITYPADTPIKTKRKYIKVE